MPKLPQHPIIIENYPDDYSGPPFLTLLEYGKDSFLTVIDLITSTTVSAYVLDVCKSEGIDEVMVVSLIHNNWEEYKDKPISVLFGALNISKEMSRAYRTFQISDITRWIGRYPTLDLSPSKTVKRRRRREIDPSLVD